MAGHLKRANRPFIAQWACAQPGCPHPYQTSAGSTPPEAETQATRDLIAHHQQQHAEDPPVPPIDQTTGHPQPPLFNDHKPTWLVHRKTGR
jgi:hypothetical protein